MKSLQLLLFLISITLSTHAQILGRFYYNQKWQLTKSTSAVYFRVSVFDTTNRVFAGEVKDFTKDGKLVMRGSYQAGKKNGALTFYFRSGGVESTGNFVDGKRQGTWKYFYANGTVRSEVEFNDPSFRIIYFNDSTDKPLLENGNGKWIEEYEEENFSQPVINEGYVKDGKKDGEWTCHLKDGTLLYKEKYNNGKFNWGTSSRVIGKTKQNYGLPMGNHLLLHYKFEKTENFEMESGTSFKEYPFLKPIEITFPKVVSSDSTGEHFSVVEVSASPSGGMQRFYQVVGETIRYPAEARRKGIQGRVYVEFIINRDGSLSDFKIIKGIGGGCDEEAIRVIWMAQEKVKWSPGTQAGKPVPQRYTLPIIFKLG